MMNRRWIAVTVWWVFFFSPFSDAAISTSCESFKAPVKWSYCLTRNDESSELLYFFHGRRKGEKAWTEIKWTQQIQQMWGAKAPTVVAISFGPNFLLTEKNSKEASGLYELFLENILPFIEKRAGPKSARLLLGESMGGFNAAQLYLRNPALFRKAAFVCPAIATVSPFAGWGEVRDYIKRTGASPVKVLIGRTLARMYVDTPETWVKTDPLAVAQLSLSQAHPQLYISCGRQDTYGFFEGVERFARLAAERGVKTTWVPLEGGHCVADPVSVARFFVP